MEIQPTSKRLLALLENARELSVKHSQRSLAVDVINSCRIYAKAIRMPIEPQLDDLALAIMDKPPMALNDSFDLVEQKIIFSSLIK